MCWDRLLREYLAESALGKRDVWPESILLCRNRRMLCAPMANSVRPAA